MEKQNTQPVTIEIISGTEKGRAINGSFEMFASRTLYLVADEPISSGTTVSVEHNDLTIMGEVVRCEQEEDLEWRLGIDLRYVSSHLESLLRIKDVLTLQDSECSRERSALLA